MVGNEIPYSPEAAAQKKANYENWLDRDPELRCYKPGLPRAMYKAALYEILQDEAEVERIFPIIKAQGEY